MSREFPELDQVRMTVDEDTRTRHLAAVSAAIKQRANRSPGRGRVLAVALALILLVPVMTLAAEDSVPGDFLYPIKRAVEPVIQVFDSDVPAERRVREVEVLFDRDAPDEVIVRHVDVARDVVADDHPALTDRIDAVVHELDIRRADRRGDQLPAEEPADEPLDDRPDQPAGSVIEDDRHAITTTSTVDEEHPDSTSPRDGRGDG